MGQAILMGQRGSKIKIASGIVTYATDSSNPIKVMSFSGLSFTPTGCLIWYKESIVLANCVGAIFWHAGQGAFLYPYDGSTQSYDAIVYAVHSQTTTHGYCIGGATVQAQRGGLTIDVNTAKHLIKGGTASAIDIVSVSPNYGGIRSASYNYVIWGE